MDKFTEKDKEFIKCLNSNWKYIARDKNGNLYVYAVKPTKRIDVFNTEHLNSAYILNDIISADMFPNIKWSDEEATCLREPILDDIERTYIKLYVINNPCFKNRKIDGITKIIFNSANGKFCQLSISFYDKNIRRRMLLAPFEKDKMYLGMKLNKTYTIEDLID